MKKILSLALACILMLGLFAGCAGTTVVISECTCPEGHDTPDSTEPSKPAVTEPMITGEGAVKTGLSISTTVSDSTSATAEADGAVKYDITLAAVTVDDKGVIASCVIDAIQSKIKFSNQGKIVTDLSTEFASKNELGDAYGMKVASSIGKEWNQQAAAMAEYAVGKTVAELKGIAVNEKGAPSDADLSSSVTLYIGSFVSGIEAAVNNATHLGAQAGDKLVLTTTTNMSSSKDATADANGQAQAYATIGAITLNGDTVTSCYIDAVQANVNFDAAGKITTDLSAPVASKNELGEAYGMKKASAIGKEWNEQAASFSEYVTGKTLSEVTGIAMVDKKPVDADLTASVTMKINGFITLFEKAAQ